jgi:ankyrin repeat protein
MNNPLFFSENEVDARPVVDCLLSKGADINARDNEDRTPLHNAADFNNTGIVQYLVSILWQLNQKACPLILVLFSLL